MLVNYVTPVCIPESRAVGLWGSDWDGRVLIHKAYGSFRIGDPTNPSTGQALGPELKAIEK